MEWNRRGKQGKISTGGRFLIILPLGLDNSRQVTIFKKWTTTLSLKQDMFRSFNDHLQL